MKPLTILITTESGRVLEEHRDPVRAARRARRLAKRRVAPTTLYPHDENGAPTRPFVVEPSFTSVLVRACGRARD